MMNPIWQPDQRRNTQTGSDGTTTVETDGLLILVCLDR